MEVRLSIERIGEEEGMAPRLFLAFVLIAFCLCVSHAIAEPLPKRLGACAKTSIKSIETRLIDAVKNKPIPGTGSAVRFANDGYQVAYDNVPAIEQSKKGDHVRICLVSIPHNCPRGDERGRVYKTTNLRTNKAWALPDAQRNCGGV
jgi:hypothetical protein